MLTSYWNENEAVPYSSAEGEPLRAQLKSQFYDGGRRLDDAKSTGDEHGSPVTYNPNDGAPLSKQTYLNRFETRKSFGDLVVTPRFVSMPDFGVFVSERRETPGFVTSFSCQNHSEFMFVNSGRAQLECQKRMFQIQGCSLVHFPANSEYRFRNLPEQPVALYAIRYHDEILPIGLSKELRQLGLMHWNFRCSAEAVSRTIRNACKEMLCEQYRRRLGWETILVSRFNELVVWIIRYALRGVPIRETNFVRSTDSVSRVANYVAFLETEFHHTTTLDEAANATGLSRRRFTSLFRILTGQTWHERLLNLRLTHARALLMETVKTVITVAFESGFEDLSHFNHVFKNRFGVSPSEFRRRCVVGHKNEKQAAPSAKEDSAKPDVPRRPRPSAAAILATVCREAYGL